MKLYKKVLVVVLVLLGVVVVWRIFFRQEEFSIKFREFADEDLEKARLTITKISMGIRGRNYSGLLLSENTIKLLEEMPLDSREKMSNFSEKESTTGIFCEFFQH